MKKKVLKKEDVIFLANISEIKLTNDELKKYLRQLEETIDYVENLNELDTQDINPTSHATNLSNVFFNDGEKNERGLKRDDVFKNAKDKKDGYFRVPSIRG